ncbi:MAG TPA: hypothetical protein VN442_08605 [Bryobacteraceae bacterium]|nr:hypothetical protein [Bryobacteraceae bacterium]
MTKILYEVTITPLQTTQGAIVIAAEDPEAARRLAHRFLLNASSLEIEDSLVWRSMPFSQIAGGCDFEITSVIEADAVSGSDRIWNQEEIDGLAASRLRQRQQYLADLQRRVQLRVQSAESGDAVDLGLDYRPR